MRPFGVLRSKVMPLRVITDTRRLSSSRSVLSRSMVDLPQRDNSETRTVSISRACASATTFRRSLRIIAYNSILLSALLDRYRAAGDEAPIARLQKISPVAWQSILFLGRYLFHGPRQSIDIDILLATATLL
jgi:hypothetical protein